MSLNVHRCLGVLLSLLSVSGAAARARQTPVDWADAWVDGWTGSARGRNVYAHETSTMPQYTRWGDDPDAYGRYSNRSDCSFFGSVTLERADGLSEAALDDWLCDDGCPSGRPLAVNYYDAIVAERHFRRITHVKSIERGDVLSVKYFDSTDNTGHFAWVDAEPRALCETCSPSEWALTIVDSSSNYHGRSDTRSVGGACQDADDCWDRGRDVVCERITKQCAYTGIGRGVLRLFADESGKILGYSWSTSASSQIYMIADGARLIAFGRYEP